MARHAPKGNTKAQPGDITARSSGKGRAGKKGAAAPTTGAIKKPGRRAAAPRDDGLVGATEPKPNTGIAYIPTDHDRNLVTLGVAVGLPEERVAAVCNLPFGISVETLKKHYARELATGSDALQLQLASKGVQTAMDRQHRSHAVMVMFMLKAKWKWQSDDKPSDGEGVGPLFSGKGRVGDVPVRFTLNLGDPTGGHDEEEEDAAPAAPGAAA